MSQSSKERHNERKCFQYHDELKRMSWGDGFFAAVVAISKNFIYFVHLLVERESNLIIDKTFCEEKFQPRKFYDCEVYNFTSHMSFTVSEEAIIASRG